MTSAPRGLATVAFLKTKLDEGCDHLGLFEPLILDALAHTDLSDFLAGDIAAIVHDRRGVLLPSNAVQTLLGRCAKRGLVHRQGGRFFRTSNPIPDPERYERDLTGDSLQSAQQVNEVCGALGVDARPMRERLKPGAMLGQMFRARNDIVHQLDLTDAGRKSRTLPEVRSFVAEALSITQEIINAVGRALVQWKQV